MPPSRRATPAVLQNNWKGLLRILRDIVDVPFQYAEIFADWLSVPLRNNVAILARPHQHAPENAKSVTGSALTWRCFEPSLIEGTGIVIDVQLWRVPIRDLVYRSRYD